MSKEVSCIHRTTVRTTADGDNQVCQLCGQETFLPAKNGSQPQILKRGSINGVMTKIHPEIVTLETVPEVIQEPALEDRPTEPKARLAWYKEHKKEMIEDLIALGKEACQEKWGLKRQHISHLKSDDLYKRAVAEGRVQSPVPQGKAKAESKKRTSVVPIRVTKKSQVVEVEVPLPAAKGDREGCLPEFPAFDSTWSMLTQIEWLRTYRELVASVVTRQ